MTKRAASYLFSALSVIGIAVLVIAFNGGIGVGYANHTGLLPVVRRILDPNYLQGDFGIALRHYHHRTFAYLVAAFSSAMGEDSALVTLNILGSLLLSSALYFMSKALRLSLAAYLAAGLLLAMTVAWTGLGLEQNHFAGNREVMPTTFAHALALFAVGFLLKENYKATALFAGLALLFHLQIGLILALAVSPFYLARVRRFKPSDMILITLLFIVPGAASLMHFRQMIGHGLTGSASPALLLYYIDFRQPHHFELLRPAAAAWVALHLAVQVVAYLWLRRTNRAEARMIFVLMVMSAIFAALSLLHFLDYHLLKTGKIMQIQFIRMSPFITVFGMLSFVTALNVWAKSDRGKAHSPVFVNAALMLLAAICGSYFGPSPVFRVRSYKEESTNWVALCRWVSEHGPAGEVYLTPPGSEGFTYLSDRSNVVEFKISPDGGQHLSEWFERLTDVAGGTLPGGRGFSNGPLLNRAFASLSADQIIALGEKYGARYAIVPAASQVGFEVVYENAGYRLVKLPGNE
jgi:hypothetical protein